MALLFFVQSPHTIRYITLLFFPSDIKCYERQKRVASSKTMLHIDSHEHLAKKK